MNCWQILQIQPTSDERAIRRAYARLLKHTRPDDDAAAYQALREAFDDALASAPYIDDADDDETFDPFADNADALLDPPADQTENAVSGSFSLEPWTADTERLPESWQMPFAQADSAETADTLPEEVSNDLSSDFSGSLPHRDAADTADFVDAQRILEQLNRRFSEGGGKALLRYWPQMDAQIARLDDTERATVIEYLNRWLSQPYHLPKALQQLWRRRYGLDAAQAQFQAEQSETLEPWALLGEMEQIVQTYGIQGLYDRQNSVHQMLNRVPFEYSQQISWDFYHFLREHAPLHKGLWQYWSAHFGWLSDYRFFRHLAEDEAETLRVLAASPTHQTASFFASDPNEPPSSDRHGFLDKISSKWIIAIVVLTLYVLLHATIKNDKQPKTPQHHSSFTQCLIEHVGASAAAAETAAAESGRTSAAIQACKHPQPNAGSEPAH